MPQRIDLCWLLQRTWAACPPCLPETIPHICRTSQPSTTIWRADQTLQHMACGRALTCPRSRDSWPQRPGRALQAARGRCLLGRGIQLANRMHRAYSCRSHPLSLRPPASSVYTLIFYLLSHCASLHHCQLNVADSNLAAVLSWPARHVTAHRLGVCQGKGANDEEQCP